MTDYSSAGLDSSATSEDRLTSAGVFGVDAKGRKHRFDRGKNVVAVTDDDDIVHTEAVHRERVPEWIDYVDHEVGWEDQWWATDALFAGSVRHANAISDDEFQTAADLLQKQGDA